VQGPGAERLQDQKVQGALEEFGLGWGHGSAFPRVSRGRLRLLP
jgi:hypothetical protein